ncbi:MAG: MOSC domain-containing protein [Proteobacteria bacterium]|nr:MOSC domain-containing protein [Pseudomonadota bacterium]
MSGKLIGIARVAELRAPLEQLDRASVTTEGGIEGDVRGRKLNRQITVLFREGWEDACRDVGEALPWITRRANLYVEGMERPRQSGGRLAIGDVVLEVMLETEPCMLMERAHAGLKAALAPDWRGGVCCRVVGGGTIRIGDAATLSS